jgi:hypothetical protein
LLIPVIGGHRLLLLLQGGQLQVRLLLLGRVSFYLKK